MALGIMRDGGMVEQFKVPANKVLEVPDGLEVSDASLAEPAAVAWHGVRLGRGWVQAASVAVIGGGSIGQLAAVAAETQGAEVVVMDARYPHQHAIRERLGVGQPASGERYDVVVEAAGSPSAPAAERGDWVKPGGTVSLLGVHSDGLDVPYWRCSPRRSRSRPRWATAATGRREMLLAAEMLAA